MKTIRPRSWNRLVLAFVLTMLGASIWRSDRTAVGLATGMGPSLQVTAFAVRAIPDAEISDPDLVAVLPQLRKLLPDHGFKLLDDESRRLEAGQDLACDLDQGLRLRVVLDEPTGPDGKVHLTVSLFEAAGEGPQGPEREAKELSRIRVKTPPNQLFFLQKRLEDGDLLLIGVGAR